MFEGAPTGTFRVATLYYGAGLMQSCSEPFEVAPGGDVQVPELVLERNPNVIEGYLIAPDGEKIVRGSVTYRVSDAASPGSNPWVAAPRNEDGGFSIGFSSPTVCDVYAETLGEALVRNVPTGTHDLRLQVAQPTWIDLTVVDERDQPLSVYSVGLALVGDGFGLTGGEHPEGRTRVQVKALPFLVQVLAEGRVRRELGPFDPDHHPAQLKVILSPLAPLRGRVIFQGRPVAGAAVWLERVVSSDKLHTRNGFPCRFEFDIGLPESTTDSEGRFEMTWRDTVTYSLLVRATDLAEYETAPTEFSPETAHSNFEIELSNGGELRGRVIPASGDSAEGVLVGISRGDGIYRVIHTAADGRYAFDHLARGAWSIRRCEEDYAVSGGIEERDVFGFDPSLAAFTVEDGRTTTFDLDLSHASSRIEGELPSGLDRGRAWHVSLVPRGRRAADVLSHAIDSSGSFRVEASLLGPHDLVFADSGEGGRDQRFTATVDLERGATTWRFPLTTGVVEGDAAPNALLEHKWSGPAGATCTTHFLADARGHFRADTLPSGAGTIAVLSPGSGSVPRAVDVPADDVLHIDLR
jgi:hypothetical protein